ncbi:thioredoxin family protein [Anaerorhabdus sp.]|uniref:thioredoxin family protein n=1 Tax=Anaerorhabdus sp. TaxID=1872524 RepID=UPI002FC7ABA8
MKLFGKKEETCSCNNTSGNVERKIMVLGACCKKSQTSFENVKQAVKELNLDEEVSNIGDNTMIASYGVMQTPALVINKKVYTYGKLISIEDAKKYLYQSGMAHE